MYIYIERERERERDTQAHKTAYTSTQELVFVTQM
jgi:hypothetical protein